MRSRKFRRILGASLSLVLVFGAVTAWFLNVEAGIAQWSPPKIQMLADGAGTSFMCAVADNKVYCWGSVNTYGQLGTNDNTTVSYIPRQVTDPNGVLVGKTITAIAAARTGTVCVVASNVPYCWGRGQYGALGDNTTSDRYYPSAVTTSGVLSGKTITAIGAGDGHVCVVASGAAYCWGAGGQGRLGDGGTSQRNTPVAVSTAGVLSGKTVTSISGTSGATCAVASGASYCWGDDTSSLAKKAADSFKAQGVTKVILDLRGNGGGLLTAAQSVSSLWLKDKVIVSERTAGVTTDTLRSQGDGPLVGLTTVVLVDGDSASASEIVAGALKDNGAATLLGEKTFGKGSVQVIEDLSNGGALKVTIAKWYTPNGVNINKEGIAPDKEVKISDEDTKAGKDTQKDAALTQLRQ